MSNGSGQFDRDIKLEEEKYQRLKQLYLGHKQELARVEKSCRNDFRTKKAREKC